MLVAWIGCVSSNGTKILVPVEIKPNKVKGGQNRNPKPFYVIKSISKALNNQIWQSPFMQLIKVLEMQILKIVSKRHVRSPIGQPICTPHPNIQLTPLYKYLIVFLPQTQQSYTASSPPLYLQAESLRLSSFTKPTLPLAILSL